MTRHQKFILYFWGSCAVLLLAFFLIWLFYLRHIEYTNDAYVQGNPVSITPLHPGFVTTIHSDDSFLVKKGQLLVTLDETDAKIALQHAEENLAQTVRQVCALFHQVFVYRKEIDLKTAQLIRDGQDYLHRRAVFREQGVSLEDYEHAIAALRAQYASLEMTGALYYKSLSAIQNTSIRNHPLVVAAADEVRNTWVALYRCKIYSPVEGLVAQRTIQVGMWVPAGQPLMSVLPLDQIWINANYKETQLRHMRLGQKVAIRADLWGPDRVFHGTVVGLPGGAGNVFSLLPPQNLSGNWIKIVQRLPVRVALDPKEIAEYPLRLGLSCRATVDIRDRTGLMVPDSTAGSPLYQTSIFEAEERGDKKLIESIIAANLDPLLSDYTKVPIEPSEICIDFPDLLEEAFIEDAILREEIAGETFLDEEDNHPFFFFCIFTTLFLAIFYNTVTLTAGIYIASELGGGSEISVYPMVFFGLGNALSVPLANPLADRIGPFKLLIQGLLVYTLFSILCALAPTFFLFNLFRVGLGMASGLFYILCRRLLEEFSPPEKLENYSIIMILMYVIVPVLGACFGAWIAYESHWKWIFYFNEPLSLFLAAYFWFFYRKKDPPPAEHPPFFNRTGYFFFFLGLTSLITALTLSQELDWYRSPLFLFLLLIGIPSLLFFILRNLKEAQPILELKLFKSPLLSYSLFSLAVLFSAYFGMIILIALWLNIYVNYSPLWIAVLIGAMAVGGIVAYLVTKSFPRRFDPRFTLAVAIIAFISSCYYSTYFDVTVDFFHLAVARFLAGVGLGLFLMPILRLSLSSYGPDQATPIFTLFQVIRSCSSSLGAGLYVILWQRRQIFFHERLGEGLTVYSPLTSSYFQRATEQFSLTKGQSIGQLEVFLETQATSLALNDALGCMGYILLGSLLLLVLSFLVVPRLQMR